MAIIALRPQYDITTLLEVSKIAKSTFYYHQTALTLPNKYEALEAEIEEIFASNNGIYGYRRITVELLKRGFAVNHKTVLRLMKKLGLRCMVRMKKYRSYRGSVGHKAPNLLNRDFAALAPNKKWVTDITEFAICGEKLYLSPILDLYNGEIVNYTLSKSPNLNMVLTMADSAIQEQSSVDGLIMHSDQGWHYQHRKYQDLLLDAGIKQSMSRKGNCLDNAVIENFFGLLKSELFYMKDFYSIEQLTQEIKDYISYYNSKRIKLKLNGMSPIDYRVKQQIIV